jgi:hypothetical protein
VGKWIDISGGVGDVEKDDGSTCTGTVSGSDADSADWGAGFGENWSSDCTGSQASQAARAVQVQAALAVEHAMAVKP